jgi:hypothetical protein
MKLAISYKIRGSDYRITINVDKYSVYDELNKVLKTICERFGKIDEFRVYRIIEEIPLVKIIIPLTTNTALQSSDVKFSDNENFDFIKKTLY